MNEDLVYKLLQAGFIVMVVLAVWCYEMALELRRTRLPSWLEDVRLWNELEHRGLVWRCRRAARGRPAVKRLRSGFGCVLAATGTARLSRKRRKHEPVRSRARRR